MAAISAAQARQSTPFHLTGPNEENYKNVRLSFTHTPANAALAITKKHDVLTCPDPSDKERLVRTLHDFTDACALLNLNINDANRYHEIRHVFGGDLKTTWDDVVAGIPNHEKTNANWLTHLRLFTRRFFNANAFLALEEYLNNVKKPYNMDIYTLSSRLGMINTMSQYLPGSNGNVLLGTDIRKKVALFKLMLPIWQQQFEELGHQLDNPNYTYDALVDFMDTRRRLYDARQNLRNQRTRQTPSGSQSRHRQFQSPVASYSQHTYQGIQPNPPFQPQFHRPPVPHRAPGNVGRFAGGRGRTGRGPPGRHQTQTPRHSPAYHTRRYTQRTGRGPAHIPPTTPPRRRNLNRQGFFQDNSPSYQQSYQQPSQQHYQPSSRNQQGHPEVYFQEDDAVYSSEDQYHVDSHFGHAVSQTPDGYTASYEQFSPDTDATPPHPDFDEYYSNDNEYYDDNWMQDY